MLKLKFVPFSQQNASRKTVREVLESNLSSEDRAALENLSKRKDIIVKAAVKGGALVVWRAKKKLCGNFVAPLFMLKSI